MNYILKADGTCVLEPDIMKWATQFKNVDRRIAQDQIGPAMISTVFLGTDHRFGEGGPPILFETMVFGGPLDEEQERYISRDEAVVGHNAMIMRVQKSQKIWPRLVRRLRRALIS